MTREKRIPISSWREKKAEICLDSVTVLLSEYGKQWLPLTELLENLNHYFFLLPPCNKVKEQPIFHLHPQSSHRIKGQLFSGVSSHPQCSLCSQGVHKWSLVPLGGTRRASPVRRAGEEQCTFLSRPVEGAAFIPFSMEQFFQRPWSLQRGCTPGNKTSPVIRCHFLNPASGSYLRIRPAGSGLKAAAGGAGRQGR